MSRTDKTAPRRVKAFYYPSWVAEYHDHSNGVCELPERPTPANFEDWHSLVKEDGQWVPSDWRRFKEQANLPHASTCHWRGSWEFEHAGMQRCGCDFCDGSAYETPSRKKDRMAAKAYTRGGWRREYA